MKNLEVAARQPPPVVYDDCLTAFDRELGYLSLTLRRLGVRDEDLEDVLHEVFLVLYRKWDSYDPARPLKPYLFGIAYRVAVGHFRRNRRELAQVSSDELDIESSAPQPDQALQAARTRALVARALARIPLRRRAVLVMHDIEEVPMREIAASLSIPLFTAYSRLRKARKELEAAVLRLERCRTERGDAP